MWILFTRSWVDGPVKREREREGTCVNLKKMTKSWFWHTVIYSSIRCNCLNYSNLSRPKPYTKRWFSMDILPMWFGIEGFSRVFCSEKVGKLHFRPLQPGQWHVEGRFGFVLLLVAGSGSWWFSIFRGSFRTWKIRWPGGVCFFFFWGGFHWKGKSYSNHRGLIWDDEIQ